MGNAMNNLEKMRELTLDEMAILLTKMQASQLGYKLSEIECEIEKQSQIIKQWLVKEYKGKK